MGKRSKRFIGNVNNGKETHIVVEDGNGHKTLCGISNAFSFGLDLDENTLPIMSCERCKRILRAEKIERDKKNMMRIDQMPAINIHKDMYKGIQM